MCAGTSALLHLFSLPILNSDVLWDGKGLITIPSHVALTSMG